MSNPITLSRVAANFEREPLLRPFGFKGGYMTEAWQTIARLESASGRSGVGLGTQNVLWSDAHVFASHSEAGGNALMFALTERALQQVRGQSFTDPIALLDANWRELHAYGKKITGHAGLRETFALNALVAVDNAAWQLHAAERGITSFDELIPPAYRAALAHRHARVASIPLMAYAIPIEELKAAVADGYFFMKIKIGQPGTQAEMLEKDKARLSAIHAAIGDARTPHTASGKLPYYFDANGRYESKDTLLRLLDHARAIGAFEQIALIEEPFPEELEIDVRDIPARLAADESAHTDADARRRIELGYGAIALKPIAKTLSMSLKIAQVAHERGVPCFCADLTVNPILVEWNKNVAARLAPFPGLGGGLGLLETNGHQNYRNWAAMRRRHPAPDAPWAQTRGGVFELGADYYARSGGIFERLPECEGMVVERDSAKVDEASSLVARKTRQDASSTLPHRFFNPLDDIENISGNLPHWRQAGVLYFVTFRTADSLPAEKLREWEAEKKIWLGLHPEPWDVATEREYFDRFPRRIQDWLDGGSGECLLERAELRAIVEEALRYFDGTRYRLEEFHVAPNHVHVLVAPTTGYELSDLLHSWKSFTASAINRVAGRNGTFWQQESYDHIVRSEGALERIRAYILNHPE